MTMPSLINIAIAIWKDIKARWYALQECFGQRYSLGYRLYRLREAFFPLFDLDMP